MGKAQTANVKPDGDVLKGWSSTGSNHFEQIDEVSPNTSDYIYADYYDGNAYDKFTMQNAGQQPSVFTKIEVNIYCEGTVSDQTISVAPYINGSSLNGKNISCSSTPAWKTVIWDNLEYDKNDMNTLEIQVRASVSGKTAVVFIYSLYARLTYSTPWGPDWWSTPSVDLNGDYADTIQSFYWNQDSLDILKSKGGSYIYEVRRNIDVWDFVQADYPCLICFVEYSTNLPDLFGPTIFQQSEADFWLRTCCALVDPDEESELRVNRVSYLQPDKRYDVFFRFIRRKKDKSFTLQTESERCNPLGGDFTWYIMTKSTQQS